jgi:tRNA G46 methylase TrmB
MPITKVTSPRSVYAARLREFPDFVFSEQALFRCRGQWRAFFQQRIGSAFDGRVIFEIGCFDADFLARIAAKYPTIGFVGLDWKCKPICDGAARIVDGDIHNVALLRGRAQDVACIFSDNEVDEIWVFHPDPCDRPVELKNRLLSDSFLLDAHRVLRDQAARLCLKTDHAEYYQSVQQLFDPASAPGRALRQRFDVTADSANYWQDPPALAATADRCFAGEMTPFERRFLKRRQPIFYFEIQRREPSTLEAVDSNVLRR